MRPGVAPSLALAVAIACLSSCGEGPGPEPAGLNLSRSRSHPVALHARLIERRVERLRGLRYKRAPRIVVMSPARLGGLASRLRRHEARSLSRRGEAPGRQRELAATVRRFQQLAGLLPAEEATDTAASSSSDQIGGAYDYRRNRVILVNHAIQSRRGLKLVLAHELTHALEDQNLDLRIVDSIGAGQRRESRRALLEGSATLVASLYQGRYLHDRLPVELRLSGQRSVLAAGGETPFAVKASTIFNYVDGALFARALRLRGGWGLVDRALAHPPTTTRQVLQPSQWPDQGRIAAVSLRLRRLLAPRRRLLGRAAAGEQDVVAILGEGANDALTTQAADGWQGGEIEVWRRRRRHCDEDCRADDVGAIGIRYRRGQDISRFADAYFSYALVGRLGERAGPRSWQLSQGFTAMATTPRSAAISFAPTLRLARRVADAAASAAAP